MSKPTIKRICNALSPFGGMPVIKDFLHQKECSPPKGFARAPERLSEHLIDGSFQVDELVEHYLQTRLNSFKSVSIYPRGELRAGHLLAPARKAVRQSPFANEYPLPLPASKLRTATQVPTLTAIEDGPAGTSLVFCSARSYTKKSTLNKEFLSPNAPDEFRHATEIFVKQSNHFQAYDVLTISQNGIVSIRVDSQLTSGLSLAGDVGVLRGQIDSTVRGLLGRKASLLPTPMNLFPAIRSIYDDKNEGWIRELLFECSTETSRRETMKRSAGLDLRLELYHRKGKQAIKGKIDPYRLSVILQPTSHDAIEIELPGTKRMLLQPQKFGLYHFVARGHSSATKMNVALSRIRSHV